ncbi:Polyketide cyclase/dehydrase (plasmid) [Gemmatirosa kalamazoonensis]|uniref:Polyketide cyclase/dehydrase n=1 Tax=Gemmatirosa kalamazoonensis TaxID=861299 RepID=W0RSC0_9BACT|nr:SRPBCC family protein [Gemmatirosa kalamazoonensis]AHG93884.1 Polyketide cyclase/dehydrase [Gemmatirosa kalamazoonensis]
MRWLAYGLGAVVALVLLVAAVGWTLPRDHVAALTARIAAPPTAVWALIADPAALPTWRDDVQRVERLPDAPNGPAWREHGGERPISYATELADPPRRFVSRITDADLPFGGAWDWRIVPDGDGASTVTVIERGSVHNPLFRFVSRFVMGHTATIDRTLRALGRKFGAEPTPRPVAVETLGA